MRRIKMKFYLVMFLATLSLISVGFASWVASEGMTTYTSGMIVVDDVMKVNNYITCDSGNITKFGFFKTGFIDKNGNISTIGTIEAELSVNIKNCKSKFGNCNTLQVVLNLESESLEIFNAKDKLEMNIGISEEYSYVQIKVEEPTSNTKLHSTIFNINYFDSNDPSIIDFNEIDNETITISVVYTFEIKNTQYYTDEVYDELLKSDFNFILSAKLSGEGDTNE